MLKRQGCTGQSTLEYALVISVFIAVLLGVSIYMKRGFSGKAKSHIDQAGQQFSPLNYTANLTTTTSGTTNERTVNDGASASQITVAEISEKQGDEAVTATLDAETLW